jgi:hypothetical protein
MVTIDQEKARLNYAVDEFAAAMKKRLFEKADADYAGWDGNTPVEEIKNEMGNDVAVLQKNLFPSHLPVDIANWSMMIWVRNQE